MEMILSINDDRLISSTEQLPILIDSDLLEDLKSHNKEYQNIKQTSDNEKLLALGKKLFKTFNEILSLETWLNSPSIIKIEIVSAVSPIELEILLLSLPWEILATEDGYLAEDARLFEVVRRIGNANKHSQEAKYSDITLAFMAADPNFGSGLQYEAEERVILDASQQHKNLNLLVEESGNLTSLENRLFELGHCDMVHLSSHGGFDGDDFVLMLEDDRFNVEVARAEDFRQLSTAIKAIFLSACHSAEFKNSKNMAMQIASIGMANVMGWDGTVADRNATEFTALFYKYLQLGSSLSYACANTRNILLQKKIDDWHLMRVYVNAEGGKGLNLRGGQKSPKKRYQKIHQVIDAQKGGITVATKETFVGRRRETKEAHLTFNDEKPVLLYGLGGTGKSSLAVRIVESLNPPYKAVFIYKDYDYISLLTALEKEISRNYADVNFPELINRVRENPSRLHIELVNLLEQYLDEYPIVLVIDDLEQYVLEPLMKEELDVMVKTEYQLFFQNVIDAFQDADTKSRLLFTSRYKFKLTNGSDTFIHKLNVPDMTSSEQIKHWLAISTKDTDDLRDEEKYLKRIFEVSKGNPGLQDVLFTPLNKKEFKTLELALDKLETYNVSELVESESIGIKDIDKYLQRIALEVYRDALTDTELFLLSILTMFTFPIPKNLIELSAEELGIDNPQKTLNRLDNFGLINHLQGEGVENHISCYGLVHSIIEPLSPKDRNAIAQITVHHLWHIWFEEFLKEYPVKQCDDFLLEINELNQYFPTGNKGIMPLQTFLEQQRIGFIHKFCITNSLIDWDALNFDSMEFMPKLELSLSLHIFEKLRVSSNSLKSLSLFQIGGLYKVFTEEREKFKTLAKKYPNDILTLTLNNFSFRPDLINIAYNLYFQHYSETELKMIQDIDVEDKESQFLTMIELSKSKNELAVALERYGTFLSETKKEYDKAEKKYNEAFDLGLKSEELYVNYTKFLQDTRKDYDKAEEMYKKAFDIGLNNENLYINYGALLQNIREDYDKAEEMYQKAFDINPLNSILLMNYGLFFQNIKKDYDRAEEMYLKAIQQEPNNPLYKQYYAMLLANYSKKYSEAIKIYDELLILNQNDNNEKANFSKILFISGYQNKALSLLAEAEKDKNMEDDLAIELAFYRYAHVSPYDLKPLKKLLLSGARSIDWDLSDNAEKAIEDRHPDSDMIATIVNVISGTESIETLNKFLKWNEE